MKTGRRCSDGSLTSEGVTKTQQGRDWSRRDYQTSNHGSAAGDRNRREQHPGLDRHARSGPILQHSFTHDQLGGEARIELAAPRFHLGAAEHEGVVRVEHQLDARNDPVVEDETRNVAGLHRVVQHTERAQLQLDVVGLGHVGVRLVERSIGAGCA